jgi:pyruvate formate lyase activating enzyme
MGGRVDFEFRTTVTKNFHTKDDIRKIGQWLSGEEKFFLQQFKDSGDVIGDGIYAYSDDEMRGLLDIILPFVPNAQLRGI